MIIATRELAYVTENGVEVPVSVALYAPEKNEKDWGCRYTKKWPNGTESRSAYGFDSAQALILTLQSIGTSLYFSDYHKSGRLKWGDPNDGYGFPVPKNARDILIGYDKRFDG